MPFHLLPAHSCQLITSSLKQTHHPLFRQNASPLSQTNPLSQTSPRLPKQHPPSLIQTQLLNPHQRHGPRRLRHHRPPRLLSRLPRPPLPSPAPTRHQLHNYQRRLHSLRHHVPTVVPTTYHTSPTAIPGTRLPPPAARLTSPTAPTPSTAPAEPNLRHAFLGTTPSPTPCPASLALKPIWLTEKPGPRRGLRNFTQPQERT